MNKLFASLVALVAIASPVSALANGHVDATLPTGESHAVDISIADDGTVVLRLDGTPVDPTTGLPALPGAPGVPAPGVPALPTIPALP